MVVVVVVVASGSFVGSLGSFLAPTRMKQLKPIWGDTHTRRKKGLLSVCADINDALRATGVELSSDSDDSDDQRLGERGANKTTRGPTRGNVPISSSSSSSTTTTTTTTTTNAQVQCRSLGNYDDDDDDDDDDANGHSGSATRTNASNTTALTGPGRDGDTMHASSGAAWLAQAEAQRRELLLERKKLEEELARLGRGASSPARSPLNETSSSSPARKEFTPSGAEEHNELVAVFSDDLNHSSFDAHFSRATGTKQEWRRMLDEVGDRARTTNTLHLSPQESPGKDMGNEHASWQPRGEQESREASGNPESTAAKCVADQGSARYHRERERGPAPMRREYGADNPGLRMSLALWSAEGGYGTLAQGAAAFIQKNWRGHRDWERAVAMRQRLEEDRAKAAASGKLAADAEARRIEQWHSSAARLLQGWLRKNNKKGKLRSRSGDIAATCTTAETEDEARTVAAHLTAQRLRRQQEDEAARLIQSRYRSFVARHRMARSERRQRLGASTQTVKAVQSLATAVVRDLVMNVGRFVALQKAPGSPSAAAGRGIHDGLSRDVRAQLALCRTCGVELMGALFSLVRCSSARLSIYDACACSIVLAIVLAMKNAEKTTSQKLLNERELWSVLTHQLHAGYPSQALYLHAECCTS